MGLLIKNPRGSIFENIYIINPKNVWQKHTMLLRFPQLSFVFQSGACSQPLVQSSPWAVRTYFSLLCKLKPRRRWMGQAGSVYGLVLLFHDFWVVEPPILWVSLKNGLPPFFSNICSF